ncbi:exocyst complex component 3-like protein 4 [Salarias fasciatus]|uniref:Formamidopyrimidine-DNA glycosylase catalytic domain-containing protein n=1 Tax=Salarias fasciatus TaxID=181472 RepID=A0A672HE91_SALFA|nr:exocyst complex component 3-like protein 4 [Salarias fasciatus]XP_029972567.1 exocyst complex component 3-like protein 4 [Salarias fasciatus]
MPQTMESMENSDEDRVSLRSNGRTPTEAKESLGMLQSLRKSLRRTAEKSPLSPRGKGSKVTPNADTSESGSPALAPPPSPSLSTSSLVTSPLKNFFQKKEEENDAKPSKIKLARSKTDPNIPKFMKRGGQIRRSLKLRMKKDSDRTDKPEELGPVGEGSTNEEVQRKEDEEEEEEEEEVEEEMEEAYTLPEIPHTPLSVMQISKLIEMEVLEEAHLNLLALRREFQQQREQHAQDSPMELAKKEKDLNLLYGDLRKKICTIVRDSNSLPSRNKGLLVPVARIIQEEERRAEEPGGLPDSWMAAWREAVADGVRAKVDGVHLESAEQKASWLAVHLGLLGKAVVEDLEGVRRELRWSYPPSFGVFGTYVRSYHRVVGQHLKKLERQATELRDLYALLDWIINRYQSERILGSVSLQLDMKGESTELQLDDDFLPQLKEKYCCRVKEDMKSSLERVIELEYEEVWKDSRSPEKEDTFLTSHFPMDIWTNVKSNVVNSGKIDPQLEVKVCSSCLDELKHFPKRFESEFRRLCSSSALPLWTEYHIAYINSFTLLQQHMEGYQDDCPREVEGFRKEVKWLLVRLLQSLEDQFKDDVKPFLRRMMTRKWLTNDEDFEQLHKRTKQLSEHCELMRPPHSQDFASRLHYHVVKEYVGQLMKNNYRCKNHKHEKAAKKIRQQWNKLRDLFQDMDSSHSWLDPLGDHLSDIIGQKNKSQIKNHLQPLVELYPDFSRKHLVAIMDFRGLLRGREHQLIVQRLAALKKDAAGAAAGDSSAESRVLFGDMHVTVNSDCLSSLPLVCLAVLRPDS